jgi:adenine-specific DNA-methyltransferase
MNDNHQKTEAKTESPSIKKLEEFKQLFPGVISDGVLDAGRLGELLQTDVSGLKGGKERFGLMWSGRQKAIEALQAESYAALIPDFENSINWDTAQNVFIEGDNLEVLKLLQNAYNDKIKMIYIDPPYNTGNDFVYNDDFSDPKRRYLEVTGQVDAEGNRLTSNTETSGRKHSNWLTMMYPRLVLARNLLTEDGAIFVSIDDNEVHNLRSIMDEIFGPENFIGQFVWAAGRKNDAKFISSSHEYILVYARSLPALTLSKGKWRQRKDGLDAIYKAVDSFVKKTNSEFPQATQLLKTWYQQLPDGDPSKRNKQYSVIDEKGVYFPADISWPGGVGPRYEVLHPVTKKPAKVPSTGWRFTQQTMGELLETNRVHFGPSHETVPCVKRYLSESESEVPYSVFYNDGRGSSQRLRAMLGGAFFDFPKDELILQKLVEIVTSPDDIVLDFFAGSGTLGHSVELQNESDGGSRKYICVTLPEPTPEGSEARKAGLEKVSDITELRLSKVVDLFEGAKKRGLRVLRLGPSAFKPHFPSDDSLFVLDESSLEHGSNSEQIAGEVLLRQGVTLDRPWTRESGIQSGSVKFSDLSSAMEIEEILGTEATVLVFLEDSFKGRDDLKSELSFAIKQAGKKMVTY